MRVQFVGSGDAFGSGGRLQACISVQHSDAGPRMLLDCGATSLVGLKRLGIDPAEIGTVFVSHLHVDHFGGVPHMILDGQFRRRTAPLHVLGPTGTAHRLTEALEMMFPGSSMVTRRFDVLVTELAGHGQSVTLGDVEVRAWEVDHGMLGGPFLGLRLQLAGSNVAYTGDTAWTEAIPTLADQADVLIAESYYWDKSIPYHLRHIDLIEHRDVLTCNRIVITHMSEDMLAHAEDAAFELAHDGLII
jgi:ribonuclease BN (tRNA processing enzyme)